LNDNLFKEVGLIFSFSLFKCVGVFWLLICIYLTGTNLFKNLWLQLLDVVEFRFVFVNFLVLIYWVVVIAKGIRFSSKPCVGLLDWNWQVWLKAGTSKPLYLLSYLFQCMKSIFLGLTLEISLWIAGLLSIFLIR